MGGKHNPDPIVQVYQFLGGRWSKVPNAHQPQIRADVYSMISQSACFAISEARCWEVVDEEKAEEQAFSRNAVDRR